MSPLQTRCWLLQISVDTGGDTRASNTVNLIVIVMWLTFIHHQVAVCTIHSSREFGQVFGRIAVPLLNCTRTERQRQLVKEMTLASAGNKLYFCLPLFSFLQKSTNYLCTSYFHSQRIKSSYLNSFFFTETRTRVQTLYVSPGGTPQNKDTIL